MSPASWLRIRLQLHHLHPSEAPGPPRPLRRCQQRATKATQKTPRQHHPEDSKQGFFSIRAAPKSISFPKSRIRFLPHLTTEHFCLCLHRAEESKVSLPIEILSLQQMLPSPHKCEPSQTPPALALALRSESVPLSIHQCGVRGDLIFFLSKAKMNTACASDPCSLNGKTLCKYSC